MYNYRDDVRHHILEMIPSDGRVVGSVGCGWAGTEAVLVQQGREVHGVDVAPEAIDVARSRLTTARVIAPEDRRPFEDESLDGLILADVLEHIPVAWEALASYTRAVRPGGWVVISVPNMRSLNVVIQFLVLGDWPEKPEGIFDRTHIQVMSRRRLERWCQAGGLVVERWFSRYQEYRPWTRWCRAGDWLTLRLFHEFFTYQWQCRCRKPAEPTAASSLSPRATTGVNTERG